MSLFHHNPPDNEQKLLTDLFVGRDWELETLSERLPGQWSSSNIRAIHGESRVGKSHLALRFLQHAALQDHHLFVIKAASGRTARQILLDLYNRARNAITGVTTPADLPDEEVSSWPILVEARERIRIYDGLISGDEAAKEISYADSIEQTTGFRILAQILGLTAELSGVGKHQKAETKKVVLAAPNEYRLVEIIGELCDALFETTRKKCLVYVDDIDLLDAGPNGDQREVTVLLRHLHQLAQSPHICIVASLRTRHLTNTNKEFEEALRVLPMDEEDVRAIYLRHIQLFRGGSSMLADDCLDVLLSATSGHVGNFLRWCRKLHDWAGPKRRLKDNRQLSMDDLHDYISDELRELAAKPGLSRHMNRIREAVLSSKLVVELEPDVMGTELLYTVLEEPAEAGTPRLFNINPFVARVLRTVVRKEEAQAGESSHP